MTEQVFIEEVQRLRPQMVRVATRYLEDADDAQDMVQDALLRLWRMHQMLTAPMDRLAFTVLKHRCLMELRKREVRQKADGVSIEKLEMAEADRDELQTIEERERRLLAAVDKLPSKQRMLLQMRYLEGTDIGTLARLSGSTEENVRQILARARQSVYKVMTGIVAASIVVALGVGSLIRLQADRQFSERYAGSCMIVENTRTDNPLEMKAEIASLLAQADAIEQELQTDRFEEAENNVLNAIDDPAERERFKQLLNQ